jgi:cytidine deaminase
VTDEELLRAARDILGNAHAPYSGFRVGAAVETADGRVYRGTNVENASYGLSICAERNAVFAAVSAGAREFRRMAVVSSDSGVPLRPCGACLQVLWEFAPDLVLLLAAGDRPADRRSVRDLLPEGFRLDRPGEDLRDGR